MPVAYQFDESKHAYYSSTGLLIPSVTQILKAGGYINFDGVRVGVLERKRQLGTLVHKLTEIYDQGENLDEYEIPDVVIPYCEGWANFRVDSGFIPNRIEHRMIGEVHSMCYGMCLDVDGWMDGDYYIFEKKCGTSESPVWGLQTAAYDLGLNGKPTARRAAVQLGPQFPRRYKLFPYSDPVDYQIWGAALAQNIWKQNHKLFTLENIPEREAA